MLRSLSLGWKKYFTSLKQYASIILHYEYFHEVFFFRSKKHLHNSGAGGLYLHNSLSVLKVVLKRRQAYSTSVSPKVHIICQSSWTVFNDHRKKHPKCCDSDIWCMDQGYFYSCIWLHVYVHTAVCLWGCPAGKDTANGEILFFITQKLSALLKGTTARPIQSRKRLVFFFALQELLDTFI